MRIHVLQHVSFETPDRIEDWAEERGHELCIVRMFEGAHGPPELERPEGLILLGGPMSVGDDALFPWLAWERALIRRAIQLEAPVLGICLGAQQIARALGASVRVLPESEIGWHGIEATAEGLRSRWFENETETVFQWHGESFDLPEGAVHLARSPACENQAFIYGQRTLALQFHPEVSASGIAAMLSQEGQELSSFTNKPTSRASPLLLGRLLDRIFASS